MAEPIAPRFHIQTIPSKEPVHQPSPPPAYTSHQRTNAPSALTAQRLVQYYSASLQHQEQQQQQEQSDIQQCIPIMINRLQSFPSTLVTEQAITDDEDGDNMEDAHHSTISLRINTSIKISSDNNLICIADTPADHANAIARAVVHAIQENSSGQCGIPMIDEDGRPRPVRIEVDAGVAVEGTGNVVGNQKVIEDALRQRGYLTRKRAGIYRSDDGDRPPATKRRRSSH